METLSETRCFGGRQLRYQHQSTALDCEMVFSVFLPERAESESVPVLWWLSGLTCNDLNFVQKAGAQRYANEHGVAIVCPDTSPRGDAVPDDPDGAWDFGLGAGFYVDATAEPWSAHYRMYSYLTSELPELVFSRFPLDPNRQSIFGHSMGGHGALTIALKNAARFKSVSAFSPIVAPLQCPWGEKALGNYLGDDRSQWADYDSCALIAAIPDKQQYLPMLVDQGDADEFLVQQLKTQLLEEAVTACDYPAQIRYQPGYDHSYFFIASFVGEHIAFHARHLSCA